MSALLAPSILSADFGRLTEEVQAVTAAGADWIHVDVMDGRFVPNLTIGPPVVAALRRATALPLDVHLMIVEPERYLQAFADAGADTISVHVEACPHLQRVLAETRRLGCRAGVALNPATSHQTLSYVLNDVDMVLCMSVNPGFGGQTFLPSTLPKVRAVRALLDSAGRGEVPIEVDGGVTAANAEALTHAGCGVLVAGTAIFGTPPYADAILALRSASALASTAE